MSPPALTVRRATPEDYPAVLAFHRALDGEFVPPLSQREPLETRARAALGAPGHGCALAVGDDGAVVAMCVFRPLAGAALTVAELVFFGVRPERRRQGVGSALRGWVLDELRAQGFATVRTRTWSTNQGMVALNVRHGFRVVSVAADERGPGVDSWYFEREL